MKKFGLRIGEVGIEFPSKDERDKALKAFTQGTDVTIHDRGVRYRDGRGSFSVYDRDTKETLVTCEQCEGVFGIETAPSRPYPHKRSYEKEYSEETGHICDACLASAIKARDLFNAKKLVAQEDE